MGAADGCVAGGGGVCTVVGAFAAPQPAIIAMTAPRQTVGILVGILFVRFMVDLRLTSAAISIRYVQGRD